MIPDVATLLRIYLNVNEHWQGVPLYRAVVETARTLNLAGASVFPVALSYGVHRQVHDAESEYSSHLIPVVIEIVDAWEKLARLLEKLDDMVGEGLLVSIAAQVVRSPRAGQDDPVVGTSGPERTNREPWIESEPIGEREAAHMKIEGDAKRLTVYLGSSDTRDGQNLAVAIVQRCRELGMAGATVSRGIMGFGKQSIIHRAHLLGLSDDLPEKIEIVDRPEQIARLLPVLDEMVSDALIVVEDVQVVRYLHEPRSAKGASA